MLREHIGIIAWNTIDIIDVNTDSLVIRATCVALVSYRLDTPKNVLAVSQRGH